MKKRKKPNRILQYVAFFKNTTYLISLYMAHINLNGTYLLGSLFFTENSFFQLWNKGPIFEEKNVFPKWLLYFTMNKMIFNGKKLTDCKGLIFGRLRWGLPNIGFILGRKIRINCNVEFYLVVVTHFDVFPLGQRTREKSKNEWKK